MSENELVYNERYCDYRLESITIDDVKERIGIPQIDPELGTVTYCEQTFDHTHIFCFEFGDDEFEDLNYFAIDG